MTLMRRTQVEGLFGARAHRSRAALLQIGQADSSLQPDLLRAALELPSHREPVLDLLESGLLDALEPAVLDGALGAPDRWSHRQRRRISTWFLKRDPELFGRWAERSALYPRAAERNGPHALALRVLGSRLAGAELPAAVHCDFATRLGALAELPALQRFADLRLACPAPSDWTRVRGLVGAAAEVGAVCTLARLLQDGMLDGHAHRPEVQAAFHLLDWSRFGRIKAGFARRTALTHAHRGRFEGIQLWAQGRPQEASEILIGAAEADPGEATLREAVLAAAGAAREDVRLRRLLEQAPAELRACLEWILRLSQPGARLRDRDLADLARLELPAAGDPLFGSLARAIVRVLPPALPLSAGWDELSRRLSARNRRWLRELPAEDRSWLALLRHLRTPGLGDSALVVLLRRALVLPVERRWVAWLFACLHREDRLRRLVDPDGTPTDLGLMVRALCVRTVDGLPSLLQGGGQEEQALLSSDPRVVVGTLCAALERPGRSA